jgi:hypothetical protein
MARKSELLMFLLEKKLTIQQAIDILEQAAVQIIRKKKEKAVITDYEKRGG